MGKINSKKCTESNGHKKIKIFSIQDKKLNKKMAWNLVGIKDQA